MRDKYTQQFFSLIILLCIAIGMCGCSKSHNKPIKFNKTVYKPEYTSNFVIESQDSSNNTLITVYNPWQGSKDTSIQLLISRDSVVSENFYGQVLNGNPERIICMSSTHVAMLDALDAVDKIVGLSGSQYVTNPKLNISDRFIPDIGYEGNIDYEAMVAAEPDLVLLFSVNGASSMEPKLKELGIPFFYVGDYVEEDPLGKSEWIITLAEILGKREEGIKIFKEISDKYTQLKSKVEEGIDFRPKIMVNAPFLDAWYMPSTESYVARMIKDAGGDYVYSKNTGNSSLPIDKEEALKLLSESDFWINIGTIKSKAELEKTLPTFANVDCVRNGKIYNNNARSTLGGGNDCYESGVVNPDIILKDMIKIFHPELVEEELYYYHQIK